MAVFYFMTQGPVRWNTIFDVCLKLPGKFDTYPSLLTLWEIMGNKLAFLPQNKIVVFLVLLENKFRTPSNTKVTPYSQVGSQPMTIASVQQRLPNQDRWLHTNSIRLAEVCDLCCTTLTTALARATISRTKSSGNFGLVPL
jgi:hypothetical protein